MKYIILAIGILIIGFLNRDNFDSSGMGDISIIVPVFLWMLWVIAWLVFFFMIGVEIPISISFETK